jgi:hypothetical protein
MAVTAGVLYGGYYAAKQVKQRIEKQHHKSTRISLTLSGPFVSII